MYLPQDAPLMLEVMVSAHDYIYLLEDWSQTMLLSVIVEWIKFWLEIPLRHQISFFVWYICFQ